MWGDCSAVHTQGSVVFGVERLSNYKIVRRQRLPTPVRSTRVSQLKVKHLLPNAANNELLSRLAGEAFEGGAVAGAAGIAERARCNTIEPLLPDRSAAVQ